VEIELIEEGWRQIHAGASLVAWSRLARWDPNTLCFAPSEQAAFESDHTGVHNSYGRLICWLTFAVGVEYLCKGVCLLKGLPVFEKKPKTVIRPPQTGDDLQQWVNLVNQENDGAPAVQEKDLRTKTLTQMVDLVRQIAELGGNRDRVAASMKLLASTIRNRDAHRYVQNVRSFHFSAVRDLFVPSLNDLLGVLDRSELESRLSGVGRSEGPPNRMQLARPAQAMEPRR
jgi:hypothetical protein